MRDGRGSWVAEVLLVDGEDKTADVWDLREIVGIGSGPRFTVVVADVRAPLPCPTGEPEANDALN